MVLFVVIPCKTNSAITVQYSSGHLHHRLDAALLTKIQIWTNLELWNLESPHHGILRRVLVFIIIDFQNADIISKRCMPPPFQLNKQLSTNQLVSQNLSSAQ